MTISKQIGIGELKRLAKEGEGLQVEFKLKAAHPDKIMREVVAFANTFGGILLLGVADNGALSGLKFPEEDNFVMEKSFAEYISPAINYTVDEVMLDNGRPVLAYRIFKSTDALVYYTPTKDASDRKVYVRNADRSIQASQEIKTILKEQLKGKSYRFRYGEKEDALMKYIDEHEAITLREFANIAKINVKQASKTLVLLVLAGVLKVSAHEVEDKYFLA